VFADLMGSQASRTQAPCLYQIAGISPAAKRAYDPCVGSSAKQRAIDRIAELACRGDDLVTFWREVSDVIAPAVPYYSTPCYYTLDPASLLATSHYHDGLPEIPAAWLALEYYEDDYNKLADIARSEDGIGTLHQATGGNPEKSRKYRLSIQPLGGEQEAIVSLRTRSGVVWGGLGLYREPGQRQFDTDELAFLRELSPHLAEGARRGLLIGEARHPDGPEPPGLIVLDGRGEVESLTPGVERWLSELPDGDWAAGKLPTAVLAVASRVLRTADHPETPGEIALARVLTRSCHWVVLHGASLVSGARRRVAVILEPAQPARITPLLMAAYGLTDREQEVTRLVLQGNSTAEIAQQLVVSPHTVQQHLKRIFDKTGVRSRRDLIGKVFFAHYEPRLRDNERRAQLGQPVRGGPMPASAPTG
jgi:DNA-binding CsgD family transcriptional regulator